MTLISFCSPFGSSKDSCLKTTSKTSHLNCTMLTSQFDQPTISLIYTVVSIIYFSIQKRPIVHAVDIMLDVVIFGINIVPISFCFSAYGPM